MSGWHWTVHGGGGFQAAKGPALEARPVGTGEVAANDEVMYSRKELLDHSP